MANTLLWVMGSQQERWQEIPTIYLIQNRTLDLFVATTSLLAYGTREKALIWCQYNIRIIPRPQTNEILAHAHRTWRQNRIGLCRDLTQILYWCQIRKSHGLAGTEFERKKCQDENQNKMCPQPTESPTNKSKQIWTPWKGTKRENAWQGQKGPMVYIS